MNFDCILNVIYYYKNYSALLFDKYSLKKIINNEKKKPIIVPKITIIGLLGEKFSSAMNGGSIVETRC